MHTCCNAGYMDHGPAPYTTNIRRITLQNQSFRTAIWTGCQLQMTVMCLCPGEDIGIEMHDETDQYIRIEQGIARLIIGNPSCKPDILQEMYQGDGVFIPAGTWHNLVNVGQTPLKLSSIYAPTNHPKGTLQQTKQEAMDAEH